MYSRISRPRTNDWPAKHTEGHEMKNTPGTLSKTRMARMPEPRISRMGTDGRVQGKHIKMWGRRQRRAQRPTSNARRPTSKASKASPFSFCPWALGVEILHTVLLRLPCGRSPRCKASVSSVVKISAESRGRLFQKGSCSSVARSNPVSFHALSRISRAL